MKAIILAGGLGTRLRSVVKDVPKPLAMIGSAPFLAFLVHELHRKGIKQVVLSIGYKADVFSGFMSQIQLNLPDLDLELVVEDEPLGTGGAIRLAMESCPSDQYLILNGDSFCDFDLASVLRCFESRGAAIVTAEVSNVSRYGEVQFDDERKVSGFKEKDETKRSGSINAGIYCLPASIADYFPSEKKFSFEHKVMPSILERGLYSVPAMGAFIDIGIPEDYARICENPMDYFTVSPVWKVD